jgi:hypothetical protein
MSMMHPLPRIGRSRRYYQVRSVVRGVFWSTAFFWFIVGMFEFGGRK